MLGQTIRRPRYTTTTYLRHPRRQSVSSIRTTLYQDIPSTHTPGVRRRGIGVLGTGLWSTWSWANPGHISGTLVITPYSCPRPMLRGTKVDLFDGLKK